MASRIELSRHAVRDLEKLGSDAERVISLLEALGRTPRPANVDIKLLRGREPWARARVGPYRVVFRQLTEDELTGLGDPPDRGYLVYRIVHRRDLERIVSGL